MDSNTRRRNVIADTVAHLDHVQDEWLVASGFVESDTKADIDCDVAFRNVESALAALATAVGVSGFNDDPGVIFDVTNAWNIFVDYVERRALQDVEGSADGLAEWNALRPLMDGHHVAGILSNTAAAKAVKKAQAARDSERELEDNPLTEEELVAEGFLTSV